MMMMMMVMMMIVMMMMMEQSDTVRDGDDKFVQLGKSTKI